MKSIIKKIIANKCMKCRLQRKMIPDETVAPLPAVRVNEGNAFENVAMDICGHFLCKDNESAIEKRYILVFSDMWTRAIHLEMLLYKNTTEVLSAIRRMIARRGAVRTITCDNDPAFKNSDKHIQQLYKDINLKLLQEQLVPEGIQFLYGQAYAPYKLSIVEGMVGITKTALKKKINKSASFNLFIPNINDRN